jgi:hypothetical protein
MTMDDPGDWAMSAITKHDWAFSLYLVSLSAVITATVGVFFGIGFLLLASPDPAAPPAEAVSAPLALEAQEVPSPANNDTAWGSSSTLPVDKAAASPTLSEPSNPKTPVLEAATMETAPIPPAGITHAKRVRVGRHRQEAAGRRWVALWRPDASAGPNPGGGFYGPPNINIGHINPK